MSERLDAAMQTAALTVTMASMRPAQLGPERADPNDAPVESGIGAVMKYNLVGFYAGGRSRVDAWLDARLFSPWAPGARKLPLDIDVGSGTRFVHPADRSGVVVQFDARASQSALLRIVD
jgi:outer membrane usher protein FimD/PapC